MHFTSIISAVACLSALAQGFAVPRAGNNTLKPRAEYGDPGRKMNNVVLRAYRSTTCDHAFYNVVRNPFHIQKDRCQNIVLLRRFKSVHMDFPSDGSLNHCQLYAYGRRNCGGTLAGKVSFYESQAQATDTCNPIQKPYASSVMLRCDDADLDEPIEDELILDEAEENEADE